MEQKELNLVEILKHCPKGTELYCPIFGPVYFDSIKNTGRAVLIQVLTSSNAEKAFYPNGKYNRYYSESECLLFPSKENRDWSTFNVKKLKFDINSLQPFDKVLVRDEDNEEWSATIFSHVSRPADRNFYVTASRDFFQCIPYNDDTKHLVSTTDPAPDFYVTWKEE